MQNWMTLAELCVYLKISRPSLYRMAQRHEIPAVKLGRGWRFDREAIDAWLSQQKERTGRHEFPWSDCLEVFLDSVRKNYGHRFSSLWIYGSWARGDATPASDVDLLLVLDPVSDFGKDLNESISLAYEATFGRGRPVVFSITLVDRQDFLTGLEPLLLNVRKEGKRAA